MICTRNIKFQLFICLQNRKVILHNAEHSVTAENINCARVVLNKRPIYRSHVQHNPIPPSHIIPDTIYLSISTSSHPHKSSLINSAIITPGPHRSPYAKIRISPQRRTSHRPRVSPIILARSSSSRKIYRHWPRILLAYFTFIHILHLLALRLSFYHAFIPSPPLSFSFSRSFLSVCRETPGNCSMGRARILASPHAYACARCNSVTGGGPRGAPSELNACRPCHIDSVGEYDKEALLGGPEGDLVRASLGTARSFFFFCRMEEIGRALRQSCFFFFFLRARGAYGCLRVNSGPESVLGGLVCARD